MHNFRIEISFNSVLSFWPLICDAYWLWSILNLQMEFGFLLQQSYLNTFVKVTLSLECLPNVLQHFVPKIVVCICDGTYSKWTKQTRVWFNVIRSHHHEVISCHGQERRKTAHHHIDTICYDSWNVSYVCRTLSICIVDSKAL